jgi:signal transduction histidine kinase
LDLLHINQEELVGKSALDVALQSDLMRSLLNHSTDNQEIKIYTGGKESYFSKEWILVENEEKLLGKVIILQNITKYHELDAAKTNFIATISHELKTPISSIKMSLSLLENPKIGELNPEQQGLLQNIKDESQRLLGITGELLDLTQVESGKINLLSRPFRRYRLLIMLVWLLVFRHNKNLLNSKLTLLLLYHKSGQMPKRLLGFWSTS